MDHAATLYLDLLEKCLTRTIFGAPYHLVAPRRGTPAGMLFRAVQRLLPFDLEIVRRVTVEARDGGDIWPTDAETMIGLPRLRNLRDCVVSVIEDSVSGDLLEAGVWRGGSTIYMRAILRALAVRDRAVWVVDSFRGLPPSSHPLDTIDFSGWSQLAVSADDVRENFRRYDLLDDQVRFVEGFFADSLPSAPIDRLAILRIDADMYASTMDVLVPLYDKLSPGGFVIIDEYFSVEPCRRAVDEFRGARGIAEPIQRVHTAGFWRRP